MVFLRKRAQLGSIVETIAGQYDRLQGEMVTHTYLRALGTAE